MIELSPQAKRVLIGLTSPPDVPSTFDLALVAALLDGTEPAARVVLGELLHAGVAVEPEPGQYKVVDIVAARAVRKWFVERAVLAHRRLDPFSRQLSEAYQIPGDSVFETRADALEWFIEQRPKLVALMTELIERDWPELCITLAEAVFGLTHHSGHHRDQQRAAQHGLVAVNRVHLDPAVAASQDEHEARERRHHERMAVFLVRLAFARTNLNDHDGALEALDKAGEHARLADDKVLATVLSVYGRAYHAAGNFEAAEDALREALALDLVHDDQRRIALRRRRLGAVLSARGHHDEAFDELHQAAVAMSSIDDRIGHARVLTTTAAAFLAAGTPEKAFAPLSVAVEVLKDAGAPASLAEVYLQLARASRASGAYPVVADEYFRDASTHYLLGHREDLAEAVDAERVAQQH